MSQHSSSKVAAYVRLLRRADAPEPVIHDFEEIISIDNGIAEEGRDLDSLDRLLLDACSRHGFAAVFSKPGALAWLRPSTIGQNCHNCHADTGWGVSDEMFDPVAEQAYRRGYDQGFDEARRLSGVATPALASRQADIHKWRRAPIYFGGSSPGTVEPWGLEVSVRSSIPAGRRFDVFQRDKRRCVVCGRSAADGIVLHVDHIVAIANGGSNQIENLQTLCEECNLGKGAK